MNPLIIKSAFREYHAEFVEDFARPLKAELDAGGVLIADAGVCAKYEKRIHGALGGKEYIVIEANEQNKTLDKAKELIENLVKKGVRRSQKLIAVGGGVVQDLVGFTASILYRGIDWVFFPTTLLAQADSCIGSKTSINLGGAKNLVGTFYPPAHIYLDTRFNETLSADDIKSGIGEMMHFYLYAASPYFDKLAGNYGTVIEHRSLLDDYIRESLAIKKTVIEKDEFDRGERRKFNYGHTFGHALEAATGYAINHGQAVTVGMDLANFLSVKLGRMEEPVFRELHRRLAVNFPDYALETLNLDSYLAALAKDKKNVGASIGCILAQGPGNLVPTEVPANDELRALLRKYFSAAAAAWVAYPPRTPP